MTPSPWPVASTMSAPSFPCWRCGWSRCGAPTAWPSVCSSVERFIALALSGLDRYGDAGTAFERAVAAHDRLQAPLLLARTRLEWAEATVRADGGASTRDFAAEQFTEALAMADRFELKSIGRRARQGLAEVGR